MFFNTQLIAGITMMTKMSKVAKLPDYEIGDV